MCYIRKLLCMELLGPNSKCNWHRGATDDGKTGKQHVSWLWSSSRRRQQHRGVGPSLPAREIWLVGASYVFHSSFPPPFLPLSPCLSLSLHCSLSFSSFFLSLSSSSSTSSFSAFSYFFLNTGFLSLICHDHEFFKHFNDR